MKKKISNKKLSLNVSDVNAVNSKIEQIKKKTEMKARAQLVLFKKEMVKNDIKQRHIDNMTETKIVQKSLKAVSS